MPQSTLHFPVLAPPIPVHGCRVTVLLLSKKWSEESMSGVIHSLYIPSTCYNRISDSDGRMDGCSTAGVCQERQSGRTVVKSVFSTHCETLGQYLSFSVPQFPH